MYNWRKNKKNWGNVYVDRDIKDERNNKEENCLCLSEEYKRKL